MSRRWWIAFAVCQAVGVCLTFDFEAFAVNAQAHPLADLGMLAVVVLLFPGTLLPGYLFGSLGRWEWLFLPLVNAVAWYLVAMLARLGVRCWRRI